MLYTSFYGKLFGGIPKMLILGNFLKMLMVSDRIIHIASRTRATLLTNPITEHFHFHYLPKLYIGFSIKWQNDDHIMSEVTL